MGETIGIGLGIMGFLFLFIGFFIVIAIFAIMARTGNAVKELREIKKILKEQNKKSEL